MKSIERGNKVLGIHINGIRDKNGVQKALGKNPFEYLGLQISDDGCLWDPNPSWGWKPVGLLPGPREVQNKPTTTK